MITPPSKPCKGAWSHVTFPQAISPPPRALLMVLQGTEAVVLGPIASSGRERQVVSLPRLGSTTTVTEALEGNSTETATTRERQTLAPSFIPSAVQWAGLTKGHGQAHSGLLGSKDTTVKEMLSGKDPACSRCHATSSAVWQRDSEGGIICLDCRAAENAAKQFSTSNLGIEGEKTQSQTGRQTSSGRANSKSNQQSSQLEVSVSASVTGVTTRRTTRSHERAKARQQQQQQQESSAAVLPLSASATAATLTTTSTTITSTAQPTPTPTSAPAKTESSKGSATSAIIRDHDKPDTPSPAPSGNGSSNTVATSRSRRSLRQGQPVQAASFEQFIVTSNSVQHKVCSVGYLKSHLILL